MAGPDQDRDNPLGVGGMRVHQWHFADPLHPGDRAAVDDLMAQRGAYVMGRNMFGPIRGAWEEDWRGWWGEEPPYHAPVFVMTHYAHDPIEMAGGTTFHFITDGFDAAYAQARAAAGDDDVAIAGGVSTLRQAFAAGVVDEITLDIAPVLLGAASDCSTGSPIPGWRRSRSRIHRWRRTCATGWARNAPAVEGDARRRCSAGGCADCSAEPHRTIRRNARERRADRRNARERRANRRNARQRRPISPLSCVSANDPPERKKAPKTTRAPMRFGRTSRRSHAFWSQQPPLSCVVATAPAAGPISPFSMLSLTPVTRNRIETLRSLSAGRRSAAPGQRGRRPRATRAGCRRRARCRG